MLQEQKLLAFPQCTTMLSIQCFPKAPCQRFSAHKVVLLRGGTNVRMLGWVEGTRSLKSFSWRWYVDRGCRDHCAMNIFPLPCASSRMWDLTMGPKATGPRDFVLKTLKPWVKITHFFFEVDFLSYLSQQWKADCHTPRKFALPWSLLLSLFLFLRSQERADELKLTKQTSQCLGLFCGVFYPFASDVAATVPAVLFLALRVSEKIYKIETSPF